eukprot:1487319-Alexandrium_andersonii.AAC.1
MVEIANRKVGLSYFMRAPITNKDVEDIRAMRLQNDTKLRDAEELWKLIKNIQPTNPAGFLRPMHRG